MSQKFLEKIKHLDIVKIDLRKLFRSKSTRYGIPFLLFMIGGSFFLREFTNLRYKYRAVKIFDPKEEAAKLGVEMKDPKPLEESYKETMAKIDLNKWENKRVPRPEGWE